MLVVDDRSQNVSNNNSCNIDVNARSRSHVELLSFGFIGESVIDYACVCRGILNVV